MPLLSRWWMVIVTDWIFPHDDHSVEESEYINEFLSVGLH